MRIRYRDNRSLVLAEVVRITLSGPLLICQLSATDQDGKQEVVARPFPNEEIAEKFYNEVICTSKADTIINLENLNFDNRLGQMLAEFDALFED